MDLAWLRESLGWLPSLGVGLLVGFAVDRLYGRSPGPDVREPGWCVHDGCAVWICRRHTREWEAERLPGMIYGPGRQG